MRTLNLKRRFRLHAKVEKRLKSSVHRSSIARYGIYMLEQESDIGSFRPTELLCTIELPVV